MEDPGKTLEVIQEIIDIIQDRIQDQDIPNIQIYLIVHIYQDPDTIIINIKIEITVKIITPDLRIEIIILILILSPHIELIPDKDLEQDHKHQIQISIDITIHTDHLQNQEMIIIDQDHHHLQNKILKE